MSQDAFAYGSPVDNVRHRQPGRSTPAASTRLLLMVIGLCLACASTADAVPATGTVVINVREPSVVKSLRQVFEGSCGGQTIRVRASLSLRHASGKPNAAISWRGDTEDVTDPRLLDLLTHVGMHSIMFTCSGTQLDIISYFVTFDEPAAPHFVMLRAHLLEGRLWVDPLVQNSYEDIRRFFQTPPTLSTPAVPAQ